MMTVDEIEALRAAAKTSDYGMLEYFDHIHPIATAAIAALREVERLRALLAEKPWPPSDAELSEILANVVGVWWSESSANFIRKGQLSVNDTKAMYAIRDAIEPYVFARNLGLNDMAIGRHVKRIRAEWGG